MKRVFLTTALLALALVCGIMLAGCGEVSDEPEGFNPEEGSPEALIVEDLAEDGIDVTDIVVDSTDSGTLENVIVTATTEMTDEDLKAYFTEDGIVDPGDKIFAKMYYGENNKDAKIKQLILNGVKYTRESFDAKAKDGSIPAYNLLADGKIYIASPVYAEFQGSTQAATQAKSSSGPSHYDICIYILERYDYYDDMEGGDTGDKYTSQVFKDAASHFGISESDARAAWDDYDACTRAHQDYF